ncbi:hypothetical protein ACQPU1_03305 [Clostridium paraputrificum]|uniref:hypothetical protein n=1 Tax=Clostridium TaxID=1485 RepID=UPI003D334DED
MEFRLNKIDTDIRRKLAEEVKDDKVHAKKDKPIENNTKNPFVECDKDNEENKTSKKTHITIDGVMDNNKRITIDAENEKELSGQAFVGTIIDKIK